MSQTTKRKNNAQTICAFIYLSNSLVEHASWFWPFGQNHLKTAVKKNKRK